MFTDRSDAAQQVVTALRRRDVVGDVVVALAPSGVPVGKVVADATDLQLDVVVIQRIQAPTHPDLTIGAVAPGGFSWINSPMMRFLDVDWEYVQEAKTHASDAVETRAVGYGETWGPLDVSEKRVVLVDDGIPTGAAMRVATQRLRKAGADEVVAAAPVAPPDVLDEVQQWADDVVVPLKPAAFQATADYYEEFDCVTDEDATTALSDLVQRRSA
ncbi:phosphoribosyltransferase family protein [Haloarcula sp. 1CSR25-25]|uniref:phosphoribosyltransferase n=1 Tax=Haloarcula sp. 1CSR25-25 TaxID=2862545 RepID=UPI0028945E89|nr:phosphoribosyltransferase family protein [Haloarcula sp. 1CSR25-25]MDT3434784.1 phosphoribosyltransferase [Haloarcula sp. 1CSR25-25]